MDSQIQQLEERIKKLEAGVIAVTMSNFADTNALRSVQRALTTASLSIGASSPVSCALLNLVSMTQGLVLSRMTDTQRGLIANPVQGLIIYNTTTNKLNYYTGVGWVAIP